MIEGILGKKVGMMQRYAEDGTVSAVTVIQAGPCHVMQVKTVEKDGYAAAQLGFEDKKRKVATKPEMGHARKAKVEPKRFIREVRYSGEELAAGAELTVAVLEGAKEVDVTGVTKGKGFQGVMKRHGFHGRPASHGASKDHRAPGSIGSSTTPGRTVKGRRMAGHMGVAKCTSRNLKLLEVDKENNLLVVRGAVPGPTGGFVVVRRCLAERQAKK
ncbi:MAG TPA: 50S ribosomal protein L3 [Candidatus Brocadiia bacterium]|nr:50S ribosomal protein L3 [Candidatus Brocadiia bacterium]